MQHSGTFSAQAGGCGDVLVASLFVTRWRAGGVDKMFWVWQRGFYLLVLGADIS